MKPLPIEFQSLILDLCPEVCEATMRNKSHLLTLLYFQVCARELAKAQLKTWAKGMSLRG